MGPIEITIFNKLLNLEYASLRKESRYSSVGRAQD